MKDLSRARRATTRMTAIGTVQNLEGRISEGFERLTTNNTTSLVIGDDEVLVNGHALFSSLGSLTRGLPSH